MKRGLLVLLCIVLGTAAGVAAAQTEQIDPRVLGAWARTASDKSGKKQKLVIELRADGSFAFHEGDGGYLGHFTAWDGQWTTMPDGGGRPAARPKSDHGDYALQKDGSLKVTSIAGTRVWRAVPPSQELLPTRDIKTGRLPVRLPQLLAQTWIEQARPWRKDALPIVLELGRNPSTRSFEVQMRFISPSDGSTLVVEVGRFRRSQRSEPPSGWRALVLPGLFRDLPDALEAAFYDTATSAGLASQSARPTRLMEAKLSIWEDGQPEWDLYFVRQSRGLVVKGISPEIREDLPLEFTKDYSLQWQEARAGLRLLFAASDKSPDGRIDDQAFYCTMIGGVWNPKYAPGCHLGPDKHRY